MKYIFILLLFWCGSSHAFTDKSIHVIFGFQVGSSHHLIFNTITNNIPNKKLNFISESKLGLSGALAHQYVAQSKPDGHVLGFTGSSIVINPFINTNIKYDILRDFDPIVYLGKQDNALVVNSVLPFKNVRELIDYSNKKPKSISYGHNGEGSSSYITVEDLFKNKLLPIPYKGTNFLLIDLMSGQIDVAMLNIGAILPHVTSSKIKVIATTGTNRSKILNVPTIEETIKVSDSAVWNRPIWYGIVAPKGISKETANYLTNYILSGIDEKTINKLEQNGITVELKNFKEVLAEEHVRWRSYFK